MEQGENGSKIMRGNAIEVHVDRVTANAYIITCVCIYICVIMHNKMQFDYKIKKQ